MREEKRKLLYFGKLVWCSGGKYAIMTLLAQLGQKRGKIT